MLSDVCARWTISECECANWHLVRWTVVCVHSKINVDWMNCLSAIWNYRISIDGVTWPNQILFICILNAQSIQMDNVASHIRLNATIALNYLCWYSSKLLILITHRNLWTLNKNDNNRCTNIISCAYKRTPYSWRHPANVLRNLLCKQHKASRIHICHAVKYHRCCTF